MTALGVSWLEGIWREHQTSIPVPTQPDVELSQVLPENSNRTSDSLWPPSSWRQRQFLRMATRWQCSLSSLRFLSMRERKLKLQERERSHLGRALKLTAGTTENFVGTWSQEGIHVVLCRAFQTDTCKERSGQGERGAEHPSQIHLKKRCRSVL